MNSEEQGDNSSTGQEVAAPDRAEEKRVDVPQNEQAVDSGPVEATTTETTTTETRTEASSNLGGQDDQATGPGNPTPSE